MKISTFVLGCLGLSLLTGPAAGETTLPAPEGPVVLSVMGKITATNGQGMARFDRAMLRQLGWTTIKSFTAYTDGKKRFTGVLLSRLLEHVGADGTELRATALNDYTVRLPVSDASKYNVLLALDMDGRAMRVRDKGPIWIIYPAGLPLRKGDNPHRNKMVWQLKTLEVR